jgi:hypothetical protein
MGESNMTQTTRRIAGHSNNDMDVFSDFIGAVNTREGEDLLLYLHQTKTALLGSIKNFTGITFLFSSIEQDTKKSVLYKSVVQFKLQQSGFGLPYVAGQLPAYEVLDDESFRHVLSSKRLLTYYAGDISNSATLLEGLTSETKKRIAYQQLRDVSFIVIDTKEEFERCSQLIPAVCHEDWRQVRFNREFSGRSSSVGRVVRITTAQPDLASLLGKMQFKVIASNGGAFSLKQDFFSDALRGPEARVYDLFIMLSRLSEGQQEQLLTMFSQRSSNYHYYYKNSMVSYTLQFQLIFSRKITKPRLQIQALMCFALCHPKLEDLLEIMPLSCLVQSNGQEVALLAERLGLWCDKRALKWDGFSRRHIGFDYRALVMLRNPVQPTFQAKPLDEFTLNGVATLKLAILYFYSDIASQAGNSDDAKAATFTSYLLAAINDDFGSKKELRLAEFASVLAMPMLSLITDLDLLCDMYKAMTYEQKAESLKYIRIDRVVNTVDDASVLLAAVGDSALIDNQLGNWIKYHYVSAASFDDHSVLMFMLT